MVERILDWLAAPVVVAQRARIARSARILKASDRAEQRLDRLAEAYRKMALRR